MTEKLTIPINSKFETCLNSFMIGGSSLGLMSAIQRSVICFFSYGISDAIRVFITTYILTFMGMGLFVALVLPAYHFFKFEKLLNKYKVKPQVYTPLQTDEIFLTGSQSTIKEKLESAIRKIATIYSESGSEIVAYTSFRGIRAQRITLNYHFLEVQNKYLIELSSTPVMRFFTQIINDPIAFVDLGKNYENLQIIIQELKE